jgi:hypothetical protein
MLTLSGGLAVAQGDDLRGKALAVHHSDQHNRFVEVFGASCSLLVGVLAAVVGSTEMVFGVVHQPEAFSLDRRSSLVLGSKG